MLNSGASFSWLFGKKPDPVDPVIEAVDSFRDPNANTLTLTHQLVTSIRGRRGDVTGALARHSVMLDLLEHDTELREAFSTHVMHFLATRRLVTFFTDSGILPGTGFFSEWWRIIGHHVLPEVPDERRLKDCLSLIFEDTHDWLWLTSLPRSQGQRFWAVLAPPRMLAGSDWLHVQEQMLDAVLLLAHRVSGLGVDSELMQASPNFEADMPRFVALSAEALHFVSAFRSALSSSAPSSDDGQQLLVIIEQCRETLLRIRKRALTVGTSLHLGFTLMRGEQNLRRLEELLFILRTRLQTDGVPTTTEAWAELARISFIAENRRNSLRHYMSQLSRLLAVRVTENAARSGEHYICETSADYRHMWRSAAGAGVLIGVMALIKIFAAGLHAPLFVEALMFSLIYGLGFVLIYLLGMTVATKQPAMTAQTLASLLGDIKPTRAQDLERLVDVTTAVSRSQFAAIAGNVMVALPVAIAVGLGLSQLTGAPVIEVDKAAHLLGDLDPLSWAIPHAAIAGFYLYLSGLISGYFDNEAAYGKIGPRIARLRWLNRLLGSERTARLGQLIQDRLGGIMGNFLFGCMLGSTGVIGVILGLPLDIRHIAFSAANIGYALVGFQMELPLQTIAWAVLGVAAIGLTNLAVSFTLALRTALDARRIRFEHWSPLLRAIGRRLRSAPRSFILPPRTTTQVNEHG